MLKMMRSRYNTAYPSRHVQQHALSDSGHEDYIPVYKVSLCTLRGKKGHWEQVGECSTAKVPQGPFQF